MIFEVVLQQELLGQEVINRWNYESDSVPTAVTLSFALASAMGFIINQQNQNPPAGSILESMRTVQSADVRYVQGTVRAVYDVIDFYSTPFVPQLNGGVVVSSDAPFIAFGMRTNRVRQDIRRGMKRVAGVPETASTASGLLVTAFLDNMNELATRMSQEITYDDEGTSLTFSPIVVKKQEYAPSPGRTAYRYYPTLTEQEANIARSIQWEPYNTLRSQVSRQYGRGQ